MGDKELTVCDIMGDWGAYQWSVTLFAVLYSALLSVTVVIGPLWTPEMSHICRPDNQTQPADFTASPRQCYLNTTATNATTRCTEFLYDDAQFGRLLTNSFDLVCDRQWLRSFLSSSALLGMLLSSVTLGLLSDKFGRLSCVKIGFGLSLAATVGAVLARDYLLLNVFFMLMSYSQVGAANALCTLVMESTSPRFRFVPVFEYGLGWGLGVLVSPVLNGLTRNYVHLLLVMVLWQLLMLPWLHWGVFESIRWLLSEGQVNRAQIELRRACRFNRVQTGARLASEIAQIQLQQVRKASRVIEDHAAPERLAKALDERVEATTHELDVLSAAIRQSFGLLDDDDDADAASRRSSSSQGDQREAATRRQVDPSGQLALSPTLSRVSFSLPVAKTIGERSPELDQVLGELDRGSRCSLTTQGIIQLAMKYSKTLQKQEEGGCFLVKMFHRKLYKKTLLLMMLSVMLETSYYGFIQANKFVGSSVDLNYIIGALSEWLAALLYMLILWAFSRRFALITPTFVSALVCLGMTLAYQLIPDSQYHQPGEAGDVRLADPSGLGDISWSGVSDQLGSLILNDTTAVASVDIDTSQTKAAAGADLLALRERINFWLMSVGKTSVTVAIQCAATIAMEAYPNNLRQTGPGAIVLVGRIGSIVAPFLFNDASDDRLIFKITLICLSVLGLLVCCLVPMFISDTKDKELCDHLNEIEDT